VILRVKKRGVGRSASPTVRLKGEKALGERGPWEPLGGRLGAVAPLRGAEAPPASFSVQEVPSKKRCAATPLRVRVMGGGGMVCGVFGWWEVGGGGGGEMVLWGWF
jgi:hypothetical protein